MCPKWFGVLQRIQAKKGKKYNNSSMSSILDLVEPPGMQVPRLGLSVSF
jgi:hypothetical protein